MLALGVALGCMAGAMTMTPAVMAADSTLTCGDAHTSIIGGDICKPAAGSTGVQANPIWSILIWVLNIMLAGVGVLAVGGVVYAGILYVTAADSAEQVKKAKGIITNVVIGLVAFGLMYSLLNWLIPGGVFS